MESEYTLLLVDDDTEVLQISGAFFRKKGLQVICFDSPVAALQHMKNNKVDCILLDVMMPEMDGFVALEQMKRVQDTPIILLTGRTAEEDRIHGLSSGADDYVIKPCSLEEVYLRIMLQIRKNQKMLQKMEDELVFPPLRISLSQHKAFYEQEEIVLSNREFDFLLLLAKHPGEDLSFDKIGQYLYQSSMESDRKNIMVTASRLRKKLEGYVGLERMIETVWGKGYRFHGEENV